MTTTTLLRTSFSLSLLAAVSASPVRSAEVRGRIVGDGGKPVAHAVVRLLPEAPAKAKAGRVETGDDGTFAATGLTAENFTIRVEAKGYAPLTQREIPAGATVQLRLPHGVKLSGVIRRRAEGTPIEGATILAWEKAAEPFGEDAYRSAKSGKDGRFTIVDRTTRMRDPRVLEHVVCWSTLMVTPTCSDGPPTPRSPGDSGPLLHGRRYTREPLRTARSIDIRSPTRRPCREIGFHVRWHMACHDGMVG
jgi:hypothetical protein